MSRSYNAIAIDKQGNKWFAFQIFTIMGWRPGGVSKFDGTNWTDYPTSNGLTNDDVESIAIDKEGNKWFGTNDGGVSKFDGTAWITYTTKDGLVNNIVYSIAIDAKGNKWFGTSGAGVSKFDGTNWTTYNQSNSDLAGDNVHDVVITAADPNGSILLPA